MKRLIKFVIVIIFFAAAYPARAQSNQFGLGIILGAPTGLSFKYWISGQSAADLAVAWSSYGDHSFHIHGDYLLHNFGLIPVSKGKMPLYYGIGARYRSHDDHDHRKDHDHDDIFGARIPVGLAYIFADIPLDIFLEIVPVMNLVPDTYFDLDLALGIRYFF